MSNPVSSAAARFPAPRYRSPVPKKRALCVALVGPGGVGGTLLEQLQVALPTVASAAYRPELRAVCNSIRMLLSPHALDLNNWRAPLAAAAEATDLFRLNQFLLAQDGPVAVIDVTASEVVAAQHISWLSYGFTVITANKLAASAPAAAYQALRRAEAQGRGQYLCETTVGAGLPIVGVLADFVRTGDEVVKIEGILSGTLSHLWAQVERGTTFAAALRALHEAGYTEPDPRTDLSGVDVARKLVILARIAGIPLELGGLNIESCVPLAAAPQSVTSFLATCEAYDLEVAAQAKQAQERGAVLRYVATVERGGAARVGLSAVPNDHPLARVRPGDNLVQVTTERYRDSPLVVQGPGAGRAVTAGGLLADLLRCAADRA